MSEKRYPTKMHEILGVEPLERFKIAKQGDGGWRYYVSEAGFMYVCIVCGNKERARGAFGEEYANAINYGITRRPRLTEEQVKRLRALITLEAMYLAKNKDGSVGAFINKPTKNALYWNTNDSYVFYLSIVGTCLSDLVSWSDPAPLDIVQTLRDAGVEVEG